MTRELFQVNLRGIVEILSHHLYSSPRVYVRELLQNARDAVRARALLEPDAPAEVLLRVDEATGEVVVRDSGIGLTADEMRSLLATVGATSKRGDFDEARGDFLGQFGIGLLSCFLVADVIEVRSRSARSADAPTVRWRGYADGTFTVDEAPAALEQPGTEVLLRARDDDRQWAGPRRVARLARFYGEYLDVPVRFDDGGAPRLISQVRPPWKMGDTTAAAELCEESFGYAPIAVLPISVPVAGVEAVAFVTDTARRPGDRPDDTVYARGMLVSDENRQLVPSWASFAQLVIEAGDLPVTASRESLQETELLGDVRDEIGRQLRAGVDRLANADPDAFAAFLDVHEQALCAMAVHDDDVLELVVKHVPFTTSTGRQTLAELLARSPRVQYSTRLHEYEALETVVAHGGEVLVNAAYTHLGEIVARVANRAAPGRIVPLDLEALVEALPLPPVAQLALADAVLRHTRETVEGLGLDLELDARVFEPASVPALYLANPADGLAPAPPTEDRWGALLGDVAAPAARTSPRLILNLRCPPVRAIAGDLDPRVRRDSVVALFVLGRLRSGARLQERDGELLSEALHTLVTAATAGGGPDPTSALEA